MSIEDELTAVMSKYAPPQGTPPLAGPVPPPAMATPSQGFLVNPGPAGPAAPTPVGWSVPVELEVMGQYGPLKVTVDLAFPAEAFQQAAQIIQSLMMSGMKVRAFDPNKPRYNNNGGGGYGQRQPWQGGGGGYNNGGGWSGGGNRQGWGR